MPWRLAALLLCLAACDSRALPTTSDGTGPPDGGSQPDTAPAAWCPTAPPPLAVACPVEGQICPYSKHAPNVVTVYRCDGGYWLQIVGSTRTTGCPATAPAPGKSCPAGLTGLDCFYPGQPCSESAISQCDGAEWQPVNGCPRRTSNIYCSLRPVAGSGQPAFALPGKQLDHPALALAGTQLLIAFRASAGADGSHHVYARLLDTVRPETPSTIEPGAPQRVGRDAVGGPALGFARDRFTLAWAANDGWPGAKDHQPGTFVRSLPLTASAAAEVLVDAAGSGVSDLAVRPGVGWLASRYPVVGPNGSAHAVALAGLGPTNQTVSRTVIADEAAELPWFATPVPVALARIAPREHGFVVAAPVPATGDVWDDSGVAIHWLADAEPRFEPTSTVRMAVSLPTRLSIAVLEDDSVVVAYRGQWDGAPPSTPLFRMERVTADGTRTKVSTIQTCGGDPLGAGPIVVPFDRGYAVGWTTVAEGAASGTLHVQLYKGTHNTRKMHLEQTISGLRTSDRLALAYAETDRSLHVAFSLQDSNGWSRIHRTRLICGAP